MGFLKKLFGGDKKADKASGPGARRSGPDAGKAPPEAQSESDGIDQMSAKQLVRLLGQNNPVRRARAAERLAEMATPTGMRPLMNAYLNFGDDAVLEALSTYGSKLSAAAQREAFDLSVVGMRRARLMDILGVTGDEDCLNAVRESLDADDREEEDGLEIHIRAAAAMARLGDAFGIDRLSDDLRLNDPERRTKAIDALERLRMERADKALAEHVRRYMAESEAVPKAIEVHAPLMADPELRLTEYACEHIRSAPHNLTVVVGSGGIQIATTRRPVVEQSLKGWGSLHYAMVVNTPEEQIAALAEARDAAAAGGDARAVFFGRVPGPGDTPPLPHFLTREEGEDYNAKILMVDPHEYAQLQDWWHYVQDLAAVPTDFEVILAISLSPGSPLTEEERRIYDLCTDEQKQVFPRAYLAHT